VQKHQAIVLKVLMGLQIFIQSQTVTI